MSVLERGDGAGLDQKLVHTDQTADITARDIINGLRVTAHHQHGPLDGLLVQVVLLPGDIVGSHDAHLLSRSADARKDTSKRVKAALVRRRHHLTDVHHERSVRVAVLDAQGALVVQGALVEHLHAVLLRGGRGRKMDGDHLEEHIAGRQPLLQNDAQQMLTLLLLVLALELNVELLQQFGLKTKCNKKRLEFPDYMETFP